MERVEFIVHKGNRILLMDISTLALDAMMPQVEKTRKLVAAEPLSSVKTLIDATNARFDLQSMQALKDLAADDKPFVKASAVVGINGPLGVLLDTVEKFSGRSFKRFNTRDEALDWLSEQ
jgi:hypothetical protein